MIYYLWMLFWIQWSRVAKQEKKLQPVFQSREIQKKNERIEDTVIDQVFNNILLFAIMFSSRWQIGISYEN